MNKLNLSYVSDIMGETYKKWKPGNIIIIDAQTGTGKNFFIENVLIPWIVDKKLLFISNRTNLKRQVKKRLLNLTFLILIILSWMSAILFCLILASTI